MIFRDYFVRLQEPEPRDFEPVNADAPIRAAQYFSIELELEEGSVVQVKTAGGRTRDYIVGVTPRVIHTPRAAAAAVTVR